jgi:hypothetical protein
MIPIFFRGVVISLCRSGEFLNLILNGGDFYLQLISKSEDLVSCSQLEHALSCGAKLFLSLACYQ